MKNFIYCTIINVNKDGKVTHAKQTNRITKEE